MESCEAKTAACRKGRPPGRQYDATVHIRVPSPALAALEELAKIERTRGLRWQPSYGRA
jgi:hypothetical protein